MKSTLARIEELEKLYNNEPLIVLAELPNSKELQKMTVADMLEQGGGFVKVIGGSNLKDLDKLLEDMRQKAFAEVIPDEHKE